MTPKVMLTCAVTGNITRPEQTPALPITPAQIAQSCLDAAAAGAAAVHIHVRDPETGRPSMDDALYAEVVERIRDRNSDLIINLTTGLGGRFVPTPEDPKTAAPGTSLVRPEARVTHISRLQPDIATLDLNTMNSGGDVVINTPYTTDVMAAAILAAGSKPEIELFNAGDLVLAEELLKKRDFGTPTLFSFVMGVKYGWPASVETLQLGKSMLPTDAIWTAFGIGRHMFPTVAMSVLMGGHVRVGLEDGIYIDRGTLAPSNAALCEKAMRIVRDMGGEMMTPTEARTMLALKAAS